MELLKLGKRPLGWIMLILLVGFYGVAVLFSVLNLDQADTATQEQLLRQFTLPYVIPNALDYVQSFGTILLMILVGASVGGEYGWGTLRPMLSTGVSRWRFLLAKLLALAMVAAGYFVVQTLVAVGLAVPIAILNDRPVTLGTVDAGWLGDLALMLARTALVVGMSMIIPFFFGVLGRSQAIAIGASLGYLIGEEIATSILGLLGEWTGPLLRLTLDVNRQALMGRNGFGEVALPDGTPGELHATLVLLGYGAVCLVISFLLFRRRDIRGAA